MRRNWVSVSFFEGLQGNSAQKTRNSHLRAWPVRGTTDEGGRSEGSWAWAIEAVGTGHQTAIELKAQL